MIVAEPFYPWRGVSLRARHTATALAGLGYAVDLLALPGSGPPEMPGVRVVRVPQVPFIRPVGSHGVSVRGIYRLLTLAWALVLALRNRYRFVHGVDATWFTAWLAGRVGGAALVFDQSTAPVKASPAFWERFAWRRAAAVITPDPAVVDRMRALHRESRVCLVDDIPGTWQETPTASVAEARERLGLAPELLVVTYVGSFRKYQGVDLVFNAWPAIVRAEPGTRLVMVGGTSQEIAAAHALLELADMADKVIFLGQIPAAELVDVLAASDVLVAPRRTGTHAPMKVLDYLRAGRAIIATDCVANRRALTSACALFVPPTVEALADGVLLLLRDANRRAALGEAGCRRAAHNFSFNVFQAGLRRCYDYVALKQREMA